MLWTDAFHEHERQAHARVMSATWGHLAPRVREIYAGHVLFALGCHGDHTAIDWCFKLPDGTELDSSPWFYEDLHAMIAREIEKRGRDIAHGIWQFDGTFERLKNGASRWRGSVRPMRAVYRFSAARTDKAGKGDAR